MADALAPLARIPRNAALQVLAGVTWQAGPEGQPTPAAWVACEYDVVVASKDARWDEGADVAIELLDPDGASIAKASRVAGPRQAVRPGHARRGRTADAGQLHGSSHVHAGGGDHGDDADAAGHRARERVTRRGMGQAVLFRRGPFSGSGWQPTGDLRYHRQERVKVETAVTGETTATAVRLLDRTGRALPLPVAASLRVEGGVTVVVGEVTLAPLGVGDYILETSVTRGEATETRLVAIRIVP